MRNKPYVTIIIRYCKVREGHKNVKQNPVELGSNSLDRMRVLCYYDIINMPFHLSNNHSPHQLLINSTNTCC